MSDFIISIDSKQLERDVRATNKGLEAARLTLRNSGVAQVLVSRRKKIRGEKRKPLHGRAIANILRSKGADPFDFPKDLENEISTGLLEELNESISVAFETARPQSSRMQRAVKGAGVLLADWSVENLKSGGLGNRKIPTGKNRDKYFKRMQSLVSRGLVTSKYGFPPPKGIYSGRFIEGIRPLWKLGRGM